MPYAEYSLNHPTVRDTAPTDTRRWRIVSDYLGNDPQPYTTAQLFEYAAQCNREHAASAAAWAAAWNASAAARAARDAARAAARQRQIDITRLVMSNL